MKSLKKNSIILILITLTVLFCVLKDNFNSIISLLSTAKILWILLAIFLEFIFIYFETLAFHQLILSYGEDYSLKKSFSLLVITKFFNGITPFATGGQPMQVYLMKKDGIRMTKAVNIIIQNFIIYQLALITFGFFAIICNQIFNIFPENHFLKHLVALGFLINTIVMILSFVISFSKKINKVLLKIFLKVTTKLKIIKNEEEASKKWEERCNDFHEGAKFIKNNKWLCFKCYIYNLIALFSFYLIPILVIISLDKVNVPSLLNSIVAISYVMIIGSFVPIPGGSGGIEFGYIEFFSNLIKGSLLNASLILWRFITYYIPMIIGAILFNLRKED